MGQGRSQRLSFGELSECRWRRAIVEPFADGIGALLRAEQRGVDFEIVDAWLVDLLLPAADGGGDGFIGGADKVLVLAAGLGNVTPPQDDLDGAANADEEDGQAGEASGAAGEDVAGHRVGVVVADIDDDVQSEVAVRGDRFVHGGVERWNKRLEVLLVAAGSQADTGAIARRRCGKEGVDAEVHPRAVEGLLDGGGDAGLTRARRAVEDDDLARES